MPDSSLMEIRLLSERVEVLYLRYAVVARELEDLRWKMTVLQNGILAAKRDASLEKVNMLTEVVTMARKS